MTRRKILLAYKLIGLFGLAIAFVGLLDTIGLIELSERGLGEWYTLAAVVMYGMAFSIPVFLILCPIVIMRFYRELPLMLPALLLLLALLTLFGPALAGVENDDAYAWPGAVLLFAAVAGALWAGFFAPRAES